VLTIYKVVAVHNKISNFTPFFLFSVRTLANFVIWRLVDFAANKQGGPLKAFKFQFQRTTSGQLDREQIWKECIAVVKEHLPFAIGYELAKVDSFGIKNSSVEMFNNIKDELTALVSNATWIDETVREKLLHKLKTLTPLIAYPRNGFSESEISAFYSDTSINATRYLQSLFELRIIDADNKFRQTYTAHNDIDDWKRYLPPTEFIAVYSASDNTFRK
jgi:predicted metalloendopeptidase